MNAAARIALVLSLLSAGPFAGAPPATIVIHPNEYFSGWSAAPGALAARMDLALGDTLESAVVEVLRHGDDDRELTVQYQVETSLTIMDDGPHLDLVDWKHHTSEWADLERIDARRFRVPKLESDPETASRFPPYTVDELFAAAMAAGGSRWADLARAWPNPADGRVAVGISTVRLRCVARGTEGVETLFTLDVRVPMGC